MTPTPCPECKGRCCRMAGFSVPHDPPFWQVLPMHVCPDCDDGTYGVRSEPEPAPEPVRTAEEERADVVAWLNYARSYDAIASARFIASGGHVGWAKQGAPMGVDDEIARGEIGNDWERRYRGVMDLLTEVQRELVTAQREVAELRHGRRLDNEDLARSYDMGRNKERAAVVAWLRERAMRATTERSCLLQEALAYSIEIGAHRREEEP